MPKSPWFAVMACVAVAAAGPSGTARADDVASFYARHDMTIIIGYNPGGTYDTYARITAKYLGQFLPGHPNIVAKNMPGVASIKAANYLYSQAPRDGSVLGVISQGTAEQQVLKHKAVQYDARKFNWLGRLTSAVECTIVWHTAPVKTIEDAKHREIIVGATSPGSSADTDPKLMNALVGTRFKVVLGYKGTTGAMLAMERGEVQGSLAVVQNLLIHHADWIRDKKIRVLVQYSLKRHPAFPDAPAIAELGRTPEDTKILRLYGSEAEFGRSVMAPPEVPRDRVKALRTAFTAMLKDQAFLAEAKKRRMEIDPMPGEALQALADSIFDISPELAARAAAARR
jgi:tripartite-type tricarboxylate transporter receptor subunit TctC